MVEGRLSISSIMYIIASLNNLAGLKICYLIRTCQVLQIMARTRQAIVPERDYSSYGRSFFLKQSFYKEENYTPSDHNHPNLKSHILCISNYLHFFIQIIMIIH